MLKNAVKIEMRIRFLLICFCSFSVLFSLKNEVFNHLFKKMSIDNIILIPLMIVASVVIAAFFKQEIIEEISQKWDWESNTKLDKLLNEFVCIVGVMSLYYFTQVGFMIIFFPRFEEVIFLLGIPTYEILFLTTAGIIYCIYRLTILKSVNTN